MCNPIKKISSLTKGPVPPGRSSDGFAKICNISRSQSIATLEALVDKYRNEIPPDQGALELLAEIDPMFSGSFLLDMCQTHDPQALILGLDPGKQSQMSKWIHGECLDMLKARCPIPLLDPLNVPSVTTPVILSIGPPSSVP